MNRVKRRKFSENIKKHSKLIFYAIFISLSLITSAFALPTQTLQIMGNATISKQSSFDCSNLTATYKHDNSWQNGNLYNTTFTINITNRSDQILNDWEGIIGGPYDLDLNYNWETHYYSDANGETHFLPKNGGTINSNGSYSINGLFTTSRENLTIRYIKINECVVYGDINAVDPGEDPAPTLTGITITPTEYTMSIGEAVSIAANKRPGNAPGEVVWTSSNPSVATVTSTGIVRAVSIGNATITARCENFSATSRITVRKVLSSDDIAITFKVNASWNQSINFEMNIKNNDLSEITKVVFSINMPENTTYMIWNTGVSQEGNIFTITESIMPGQSKTLNGQLDIPSGYNISNYRNPTFTILQAR